MAEAISITPSSESAAPEAYQDLTVQWWYREMCRLGQVPELLHVGWSDYTGTVQEQIMCSGRYDHDDAAQEFLWRWMRQHELEVRDYLRGLGSYRDITGSKIPARFRNDWSRRVVEAADLLTELQQQGVHVIVQQSGEVGIATVFDSDMPEVAEVDWLKRYLPRLTENRDAVRQVAVYRRMNAQYRTSTH